MEDFDRVPANVGVGVDLQTNFRGEAQELTYFGFGFSGWKSICVSRIWVMGRLTLQQLVVVLECALTSNRHHLFRLAGRRLPPSMSSCEVPPTSRLPAFYSRGREMSVIVSTVSEGESSDP